MADSAEAKEQVKLKEGKEEKPPDPKSMHDPSSPLNFNFEEPEKEKSGETSLESESDAEDDEAASTGSKTPPQSRSRSHSPSQRRSEGERRPTEQIFKPSTTTITNALVNLFTLIISVGVFTAFLVGSYDYFKNVEENKCEMTYMYKYPFYLPIPVGNGLDEKYPMYGLYAYTEGEQSLRRMSAETYQYTGIPVLYVPGNAGSYQQVRSFASVALQKYLDVGTNFHFDFFTVDLNEEFSALYGYTLERQVEFVKQALVKIVNLYEEFHQVVLIGHSMGGIIAKGAALGEGSLSDFILTLATPHHSPPTILDPELDLFYHNIKRNWTNSVDNSKTSPETEGGNKITLVSIAGGDRDHLVQSKLTTWPFTDIHVKTTGIPSVWASTDHLCIVWCKQLVKTVTRVLFDLVEYQHRNKYYAITGKEDVRIPVLKYHLMERSGGKSYHGSGRGSKSIINLSKNVDQLEVTSGMHCVRGGQRPSYALFPTSFLQKNSTDGDGTDQSWNVIVLSTNIKDKNWIMGCIQTESSGFCSQAENLSNQGKIIPHIRRRRKLATFPLSTFVEKYSHLVIKLDTLPFQTCVMVETYSEKQRTRQLGGQLNVGGHIFYNFTVPPPSGFLSLIGSWKVTVTPADPSTQCPHSYNLLAIFSHGQFYQSRFLQNESIVVRYSDYVTGPSSVAVYLEPTCRYIIRSTVAPLETAGQFFRLVLRFLPSFYASVLLMALYFQADPNNWSSFHVLIFSNAYHLSIFPGFFVAIVLHFLPTDWPVMVDKTEYSVVVPILCYMIAYCGVLIVSSGIWYTLITGGTVVHSVLIRVLSSRFGAWLPRRLTGYRNFTSVTDHVTEAAAEWALTRFPFTISVMLVSLAVATNSGSLAICVAIVIYLVKLFKIYEDLLEDLLKAKITNVTDSLSPFNYHFCCLMLWLVLGILSVPSLLHWTRSSFSASSKDPWDLSMYLCLLLLPTIAVLWQDIVPNIEPNVWRVHRYVFYGVGIGCVLWGTHRLYVTAFLITFVFLTMALCQLISVMINSLQVPPATREPQAASTQGSTTAEETTSSTS